MLVSGRYDYKQFKVDRTTFIDIIKSWKREIIGGGSWFYNSTSFTNIIKICKENEQVIQAFP